MMSDKVSPPRQPSVAAQMRADPLLIGFQQYLQLRNLSPNTAQTWSGIIGPFLAEGHPVTALGIRAHLRNHPTKKPNSLACRLTALRAFCRWLHEEGLLLDAEMLQIQRIASPKIPRTFPLVLSEAECAALIEQPPPPPRQNPHQLKHGDVVHLRDTAIIELIYGAGLRVAELCNLDLQDVRLEQADPSAEARDTDKVLRIQVQNGKGGKSRVVWAGAPAAEAYVAYLARRKDLASPRTGEIDPRALFIGPKFGRRIGTRRVHQLLVRRGAVAGVYGVHPASIPIRCGTALPRT